MKKIIIIIGGVLITLIILSNLSKNSEASSENKNNKYLIGHDYKKEQDVFGTYCDEDCNFYIKLGDIKNIKYEIVGIREEIINEAIKSNFDGYAFINKGGGLTGIGFWRIKSLGLVTQKNNYPTESAGQKFKGANIRINWRRSSMGLEIYPDGIYQIRNSPNGLDWYNEYSSEKFKVILAGIDGSVKFIKK